MADNRAIPADYLFPLSRRIIAECAAVNQKRLSGRSCKPAAIQFFFRLAGPQEVPFSIYPNLDPGMVIVAVRPTRRVYLTCCKPDISDCRSFFYEQLKDRIAGLDEYQAAVEINYWCAEHATYEMADDRTAGPMTMYRSGKGRCGEESTFTVTALRTSS